jgi:glycosyltransferase involved in cell wall biosynthesis
MKSRHYAFVTPRFGEGIAAGAEALMFNMACQVAKRGHQVTVLSTCARDNRTWEDYFPPGMTKESGLTVQRFTVDKRNLDRWIPIQIAISEGMRPSVEDQLDWMAESVNSAGLYQYIVEHGATFDALFFAPYLFGLTFWGSFIHPERSFLIPCLHDEHYAYLEVIASMFRSARGALFNALPEMDLARALYGDIKGGEVGMGFNFEPFEQVIPLQRSYFADKSPYLLYAGRKETGKNVQLVVDYFIDGKDQGRLAKDLRLVIAGSGSFTDLHRPLALQRSDIIDIAQVSEEDKLLLMRDALALCQLSTNESFSIVIMEAWLMGTPVIVHANCAVTRHFALDSGAGLPVKSSDEFIGSVNELMNNPELSHALAQAGARYVRSRFNWQAVMERFDNVMREFDQFDEESIEANSVAMRPM